MNENECYVGIDSNEDNINDGDLQHLQDDINDKILENPDDYLYLHELLEKEVSNDNITLVKDVFTKLPNIYVVIDFPKLLIESNTEEMVSFLYDEYLKNKDRFSLELLEDQIRDIKDLNPDLLIIEYHNKRKSEGVWNY